MSNKTVFHVDMDAFFVSVEELSDPTLKGKPVIVGGRGPERGVVAAASYAARRFGVHSAMPLRRAHRLCPRAVFIEGHPERYREYSRRARAVLSRFSPRVEMVSIDEAYLDMSGGERLFGRPLAAAHRVHESIGAETGLPCSIGIGTSRLVAKISSAMAKPNGVLWVAPGAEANFLAPLDVGKIPGVGKVARKSLRDRGIHRIGQLAELDEAFLESNWGKLGLALAGKAQGLDAGAWFEGEIGSREIPKSVSHETTFREDTTDPRLIEATLAKLAQMVGRAPSSIRSLRTHGATQAALLELFHDYALSNAARGHRARRCDSSGGPGTVSSKLGATASCSFAGRSRRIAAARGRPARSA